MTTATATHRVSTNTPEHILRELDQPYTLSPDQVRQFREDGYLKIKSFFSPELLAYYDTFITQFTLEKNAIKGVAMKDRTTYDKAFIQVSNLWVQEACARELAFSKRAARAAAELMGTAGVRMWHDQSLYKESGGGFTPWHVDQYYWPMSSGNSVTLWAPLSEVPIEKGPLSFGRSSHLRHIARDIPISDESEQLITDAIKTHKIDEVFSPYEPGEVSFHYGWTLHRAGPNTTPEARRVYTVIYMDQDMRLIEPDNKHRASDWRSWTPTTRIGEVMSDLLNPVLWSKNMQP